MQPQRFRCSSYHQAYSHQVRNWVVVLWEQLELVRPQHPRGKVHSSRVLRSRLQRNRVLLGHTQLPYH